jgi:hypothetical protein
MLATQGAVVSVNDGQGLNQSSAMIKVDVEIPLTQNSWVLPWLFGDKSIRASTQLRTERYNGFYQE